MGASDSPPGLFASQSGGGGGSGSGRKAGPPQVRPGLSEGLEGGGGAGRRQRLSLLDDLQEEEVSLPAIILIICIVCLYSQYCFVCIIHWPSDDVQAAALPKL